MRRKASPPTVTVTLHATDTSAAAAENSLSQQRMMPVLHLETEPIEMSDSDSAFAGAQAVSSPEEQIFSPLLAPMEELQLKSPLPKRVRGSIVRNNLAHSKFLNNQPVVQKELTCSSVSSVLRKEDAPLQPKPSLGFQQSHSQMFRSRNVRCEPIHDST